MALENPFEDLRQQLEEIKRDLNELKKAKEPPEIDEERYFSIEEVCDYLPGNPAKATIYGKVHRNEIPYHKFGKRLVFIKSDIDDFIKNGGDL